MYHESLFMHQNNFAIIANTSFNLLLLQILVVVVLKEESHPQLETWVIDKMARIGQVAIVGGDDGIAVVRKEVIIDPETGLLIEVQHIKAAVDIGGGDIAVREQKKIRVIGVAVCHYKSIRV